MAYLENYLSKTQEFNRSKAAIAYLATLDHIHETDPLISNAIIDELKAQRNCLKMIASENYSSLRVQLSMGNLMTDKYAEGFPFHRFYAGCENVDRIEKEACDELKKLFSCQHAYVQPHSGADANMVAYWSIIIQRIQNKELEKLGQKNINSLTPTDYEKIRQHLVNQKLLGMSLNAGGHLTHGFRMNMSSKMLQAIPYDVDPVTHLIDYAAIREIAMRERPLILVAGYSAYSRKINFAKMKEIAVDCGATLLVDMAHFSGLVAGGVFNGEFNPIPYADIVTSTTHKTLRGPRGGMVLCTDEFKETIDKGCPVVLGGPLPHVMGAKAIAFKEANTDDFKRYAHQIVKNCKALAEELMQLGVKIVTDGTDNHLFVIDAAKSFGLTGRQAELALREAGITANRNTVPFDVNGAWTTSGVRFGTAALTTRGLKEHEMRQIGKLIHKLLKATKPKELENSKELSKNEILTNKEMSTAIQQDIQELLKEFPLYPEIIVDGT
jgi:glycine hydroxymethyltransferase